MHISPESRRQTNTGIMQTLKLRPTVQSPRSLSTGTHGRGRGRRNAQAHSSTRSRNPHLTLLAAVRHEPRFVWGRIVLAIGCQNASPDVSAKLLNSVAGGTTYQIPECFRLSGVPGCVLESLHRVTLVKCSGACEVRK